MKKQLPTNGITNELAGSSVFFTAPTATEQAQEPVVAKKEQVPNTTRPVAVSGTITPPVKRDTMPPRQQATTVASNHATMPPQPREPVAARDPEIAPTSNAAATSQATLEEVRKAVKPTGKEAATYRLTVAEKQALSDIAYTYQRRRTKTSENEIARIAINWLLLDYQAHKAQSVLARLLDLLHG